MEPNILSLLRIHDVCRGLSDEEIEAIADKTEILHAEVGEVIHPANKAMDALYLVVQGSLKLTLKTPGGERQTIRYVGVGDQFGALLLITGDQFPVDVEVDHQAILLKLKRESAEQFTEQFPLFRRNLLRKLGVAVQNSVLKQRKRATVRIVSFIHADKPTHTVVAEIAKRLATIGEKIGVFCDSEDTDFGSAIPIASLRNSDGTYIDENDVRTVAAQWQDFDRIFLVVDRLHPVEKLVRLVELSEMVFCLSTVDDRDSKINELKGLMERSPSWKSKSHFVWVLGEDEQVAPLVPELPNLVERDFKVQLTESRSVTRLFTQGIDRIVHYLRGVSIGLALSGGAARGMSHLGVFKALEEAGITIDRLAGTSAGVLTGVLYCAGYSPEWGIEHFTKDLEPGSIYKKLPKGDGFYMLKQYRSNSWNKMLRKYLGDWRLEQCPVPVSTITTDLVSASSVVRSSGDCVDSILESINLPVLSAPICRDGMLLVDGGVLNNLPADVMVKQGCNFVIGVDVSANIEHRVGDNLPSTPTEKMKAPDAVATLMRCLNVQAHNMSGVGAQPADVMIAPDVSNFASTAFTQTPEMAEIAQQTTVDALPKIREALNSLDANLFSN